MENHLPMVVNTVREYRNALAKFHSYSAGSRRSVAGLPTYVPPFWVAIMSSVILFTNWSWKRAISWAANLVQFSR